MPDHNRKYLNQQVTKSTAGAQITRLVVHYPVRIEKYRAYLANQGLKDKYQARVEKLVLSHRQWYQLWPSVITCYAKTCALSPVILAVL